MKKSIFLVLAIAILTSFSVNDASARTVGVKFGYVSPMDDLKDYDNDMLVGVYFNMGHFIFNSLNFRPSLDVFDLEKDKTKYSEVWGIHFDWYWNFMKGRTFSPFLGFGPVLNYYNYDDSSTQNEDSDAGIDLFAGADLRLGLPVSLLIEGRYKMLDIADRGNTAWTVNLGIGYDF